MTANKITLTLKKVSKGDDNNYRVYELQASKMQGSKKTWVEWMPVSKPYAHSTSAFAALGRLYQKEAKELSK